MPTDNDRSGKDNLPEFTDCLSAVSAMVDEYSVESVYVLDDFNAHPKERFALELFSFCNEQNWCCVDMDILGIESDTYTFLIVVTK